MNLREGRRKNKEANEEPKEGRKQKIREYELKERVGR